MNTIFAGLNNAQKRAATAIDGTVLIVAGAGTGKTGTLVRRLAYLVTEGGIGARQILAVTFTAKAAQEMRTRAAALCDGTDNFSAMHIGTVHALCYEILKTDGAAVGIQNGFGLLSPDERSGIIHTLSQRFFPDSASPRKRCESAITLEKSTYASPESRSPLCRAYQKELSALGLLDFDDLILKTIELLTCADSIAEKYRSQYRHILVDEFQDINPAQYTLITRLCRPDTKLCAVGDADQAIYGFRGASIDMFLNFENDFPDAAVIFLEHNYRSTETILSAARAVISRNKNRRNNQLKAARSPGPKVLIQKTFSEREEALFIADEIERLVGGTRLETMGEHNEDMPVGFGDIAVLYRLHHQAAHIHKALAARGIPVACAAQKRFFEKPAAQPLVDCLQAVGSPDSTGAVAAFFKSLPGGPGPSAVETASAEAARRGICLREALADPELYTLVPGSGKHGLAHAAQVLEACITAADRLPLNAFIKETAERFYGFAGCELPDDVLELSTAAAPFSHLLCAQAAAPLFLTALLRDEEPGGYQAEAVRLMTAHGSKGLEFPVVFIAGAEEGLFPYNPDQESRQAVDIEEERRLFYVAMTRARELLYIVHAQQRIIFGKTAYCRPSSFLDDLASGCVIHKTMKKPQARKKKKQTQLKLFA